MPQDDGAVHYGARGQPHRVGHQGVHQRVCRDKAEHTNPMVEATTEEAQSPTRERHSQRESCGQTLRSLHLGGENSKDGQQGSRPLGQDPLPENSRLFPLGR